MMMLLVIAVTLVAIVSATNVPLTMLSDPKAKCLDGTQAGYYYQKASTRANKNKWVIYLNGGGECDTESACKSQTYNSLGSSKYFSSQSDASGWYLASDYCVNNPTFCEWNHVFDPYCTQDLHAGQVTTPSEKNWGLYFSGHHVLSATLDDLDQRYNLADATEIIVSGASAGGIGVWMNLDYIAQRYPKARVTGLTIAGHYFYATYYTGPDATSGSTMADFRQSAWPHSYDLYEAYVDEDCKAAFEKQNLSPGYCMISNVSYPYIQTDAFVVQALTDSVVLTGHDNWPQSHMNDAPEQQFMNDWYHNMTVALQPLMQAEDTSSRRAHNGVFAAACYIHTDFYHDRPLLNGINFYQAFARFYFNETTSDQFKLADSCGIMCNPTC